MSRQILYLTPGVFDKGGISRYCRYQLRAIRESLGKDSVTVLSLLPPDERGFETPVAVDFASFGANRRGKLAFAAASVVAAVSDRPHIVWCAHVHLAPLAEMVARATRARTVLNVYGIEVWTNVTRLRAAAIRRADRLVSDCHATLDHVLTTGLHDRAGTDVHWDCVDLVQFYPADSSNVLERLGVPATSARPFTVLTLARLSRDDTYKGVDRLIDAVARVPRTLGVRLIIGGGGDQIPALRERARAHGIGDHVHFLGYVTEADLPNVYRACDTFSLITNKGVGVGEGIPLTPLEAAACGKPILVGNQDGSRESTEDGVSGFVLDPFDLDAIADRIARLATDVGLRERLGHEARARIEREHSFERFRERVDGVLRSLALLPDVPRPPYGRALLAPYPSG
jgi:phosphatidylinositol alpha-1,6-mannosyltransferase